MSPRWIVLLALFAVATLLAVVAGRLKQKDDGFMSFVIAFALASQVVIPDFWRAVVLALFFFVACFAVGAGGIGAVLAAILIGAYYASPGGASALVLGIVALVAIIIVLVRVGHLKRINRAGALVPGDRPRHDVELGGKVRLRTPLTVAGQPELRAAFYRLVRNDGTEHDVPGVTLEVVTPNGIALVELAGARLTLSRIKQLEAPAAMAILAALDLPEEKRPETAMKGELRWIEDGDAVYMVGTPVWERAPALGDGYRDSPLVPVFRTSPESRVFLADKSEEEVRLATIFEIWAWSAWGTVCATVSHMQFTGIL